MVVIVIIGLLATVVAINVLPSQDKAMVGKARADISVLEQAVETYRLDNLTFPTDQQGLKALTAPPADLARPERYRQGGYVRRLPEDPWGNPYYWMTGELYELGDMQGTDLEALRQGYVSLSPIGLDHTEHAAIEALAARPPQLPN